MKPELLSKLCDFTLIVIALAFSYMMWRKDSHDEQ